MGYLTDYALDVLPRDFPVEVIGAALTKSTNGDDPDFDIGFVQALLDHDVDGMKWYSHDNDMKALSKELPDVLFRLSGVGEEQGDEWVKFYLNGEVEEHFRQNWNPPRLPNKTITYTTEHRERAKASQSEVYDKIKQEQADREAKRQQAKREKAAQEIQALAAKAGVEVVVKGVGE